MLAEGERAPSVCLPAWVNGERERVDLAEYLGEGIVVLAFYPADFNPACGMQSSDLGDLDLFTMQKDVSVFGVSPDSTHSHEAFAERYSLKVPLLSDVDGEAAAAYDVELETGVGERLVERAVFVVDHRGVVEYAWSTDDLEAAIDVGPVKRAVGDIGGDDTALERYRVGHDHYAAGREAFDDAMVAYEDGEWMVARNGFEAAEPEFTAAADHFDTAVRFAETADFETVVDRAEEKADTLQHAANWLADSADELASGRGKKGMEYREDAERLLDSAADLREPPTAAAFDLSDDGIELADFVVVDPADDEDDGYAWQADDGDEVDTDLGVDDEELDAAVEAEGDERAESGYDRPGESEGDAVEGDLEMNLDVVQGDDAADEDADSDAGSESSIEGDTVEGDLEMDLDAIEAAEDDGSDGKAGESGADTSGDSGTDAARGSPTPAGAESTDGESGPDDESETDGESGTEATAPVVRGGSADAGAGSAAGYSGSGGDAPGWPRDDGSAAAGDEDPNAAAGTDDGDGGGGDPAATGDGDADDEDGDVDDEDDEIEELDLADPTEGEDETEDDDERADWDIPGR